MPADAARPDVADVQDIPALDAPDAPSIDAPETSSVDAADVPPDMGPARCTSSGDCVGNADGPACDAATGRCVPCTASDDRCPTGQYCAAMMNRCVAGCRVDDACATAAGDGGLALRRCDTAAHQCVECIADEHCALGNRCMGNRCVPGCSATRGCPTGHSCCGGGCVDTQSNTDHCGACDRRCTVANASAACVAGQCTVGACTAPFADCDGVLLNGCEANLRSAVDNCGGCGDLCPRRTNAEPACASGRCRISCRSGFDDCDATESNGCETDLSTSGSHCGGCGVACAGGQTCVMGRCVCPTGRTLCGGSCVDTTSDIEHCGACGRRCTFPGAIATCRAGACEVAECARRLGSGETVGIPHESSGLDARCAGATAGRRILVEFMGVMTPSPRPESIGTYNNDVIAGLCYVIGASAPTCTTTRFQIHYSSAVPYRYSMATMGTVPPGGGEVHAYIQTQYCGTTARPNCTQVFSEGTLLRVAFSP